MLGEIIMTSAYFTGEHVMNRYKNTTSKFTMGDVVALPDNELNPYKLGIVMQSNYGSTYVSTNEGGHEKGHSYHTDDLIKWNNMWIETIPDNPLIQQVIESREKRFKKAQSLGKKKVPTRMFDEYTDRKKSKSTNPKRKPVKCSCKKK